MKDAGKVQTMCLQMLDTGRLRMENMALINALFNGSPPWTTEEARRDHQHTNVNWLEGTEKLHEARSQARNALKSTDNFFAVKLDIGSPHHRREWSSIITKNINRVMKRSREYNDTIDSSVSQMILHGIGPSTWQNRSTWCPKARSISDVLVPTETLTSLANLSHFAVRVQFTLAELAEATTGENVDPGWNVPLVSQIMEKLRATRPGQQSQDLFYDPIKWIEDFKQNGLYWQSDAVPVLHAFDFYFFEASSKCWRRRIVVDCQASSFSATDYGNQFLYDNNSLSFGKDVNNVLHAQIADGAVVAPAKWHSVRSLGYMLYPICQAQNRLRCKFMDSVWESMLWYFRNVSEADREVIQKVDLRHLGVIPNGLSFVPSNERHNINFELVSGQLSMNRQLMSEHSASFTQGINDGTSKEMTATEAMARVSSQNKIQNAMLANIYEQQLPQYREISRRFCVSDDDDCVTFRNRCMSEGVDQAVFDVEAWEVIPEKAVGGGDRMMQIAIADKLMMLSPGMSPEGQIIARHIAVEAVTADSALANELVPLGKPDASSSVEKATLAWATLMDGMPVILGKDINHIEFVETLFHMLNIELERINGMGQIPTVEKVEGMKNVILTINGQIQKIATDPAQQERVKGYQKLIGGAENFIRIYEQKIAQQAKEHQAQQGGPDQQSGGEVAVKLMQAQSDAKIAEAMAQQKLRHKQMAFNQGLVHKDAKTAAEIAASGAKTQVELAGQSERHKLAAESKSTKSTE